MESVKMADVQAVGKKFLVQPVIVVVTPDPAAVQVPGYQPTVETAQTQPVQMQPAARAPAGSGR